MNTIDNQLLDLLVSYPAEFENRPWTQPIPILLLSLARTRQGSFASASEIPRDIASFVILDGVKPLKM
jgi:hypothetical protein